MPRQEDSIPIYPHVLRESRAYEGPTKCKATGSLLPCPLERRKQCLMGSMYQVQEFLSMCEVLDAGPDLLQAMHFYD